MSDLIRNCPECGSRFTYAVPTRDKPKVVNDLIQRDASGEVIMIKCRRCRKCGKQYFDDSTEQRLSKQSLRLLEGVNKFLEERDKKKAG